MKTNPDDNAFQEGSFGKTNTLTKREYFAAMALTSIDINPSCDDDIAQYAVKIADALIMELNKNGK